ncbi:MAG: exodeoxyribonuclease VII small subunit [Thermodesulfobacteriota bacterium]
MKKMSFEQAMERLEKIVQQMESGDLPLESTLVSFEEGMKLTRFLTEKLDEVQKKVSVLTADAQGNTVEKPFMTDADGDQG